MPGCLHIFQLPKHALPCMRKTSKKPHMCKHVRICACINNCVSICIYTHKYTHALLCLSALKTHRLGVQRTHMIPLLTLQAPVTCSFLHVQGGTASDGDHWSLMMKTRLLKCDAPSWCMDYRPTALGIVETPLYKAPHRASILQPCRIP